MSHMTYVSTQGIDEHMINAHYYYNIFWNITHFSVSLITPSISCFSLPSQSQQNRECESVTLTDFNFCSHHLDIFSGNPLEPDLAGMASTTFSFCLDPYIWWSPHPLICNFIVIFEVLFLHLSWVMSSNGFKPLWNHLLFSAHKYYITIIIDTVTELLSHCKWLI